MKITAVIDTVTFDPGNYSNRSDVVTTYEEWTWPPHTPLDIGWRVKYGERLFTVRAVQVNVDSTGGRVAEYQVRLDHLVARVPAAS